MITSSPLSIGAAARATELSVKAIRYYEEIGLIPQVTRTHGGMHAKGQRRYTAAEVGRLRFIRRARLLGLSLPDIRQLLAASGRSGCPSRHPEYPQILKDHLREIDQRLHRLRALRAEIVEATVVRLATADVSPADCACLQRTERASLNAPLMQQRNECECGCCSTLHAAPRRAPTGKPLDVPIVSVRNPPQGRGRGNPGQATPTAQRSRRIKA